MKAFVISDTHISDDNIREEAYLRVFGYIESLLRQNFPHFYLHLGDVFEDRSPSPQCLEFFLTHLFRVLKTVDRVILLKGNHDCIDNKNSSLDFLRPLCHHFPITVLENPSIVDLGKAKVFLGHFDVEEAKVGAKRRKLYLGVSQKSLIEEHPNVKYFLLGHIHSPQILSQNPLIFVPGSIYPFTFAERLDKKFAYLLDLDTGEICKFPLPIPKLIQVEINLIDKSISIEGKRIQQYQEVAHITDSARVKCILWGNNRLFIKLDFFKLKALLFPQASSVNVEYREVSDANSTAPSFSGATMRELFSEYLESLGLEPQVKDFCLSLFNKKVK